MARSMSRSRQKSATSLPEHGSPLSRRVTRSQSREREEARLHSSQANSHQLSRHDNQKRWGQSTALSPLIERSPVGSPLRSPLRSAHKSSLRYGSTVVPESPEDAANISGTTILPLDFETDLDPEMMLEALPDLEKTGERVLGFLAPRNASPVSIINTAKRLSDPGSTHSRRLTRLRENLSRDVKHFGNQTYIDVGTVRDMLFDAFEARRVDAQDWRPDPILQMTNCALLAVDVLLARDGNDSQRQAIRNLEHLFPLPFMNDLAADGQAPAAGESALDKDTFDLALDIRTQSLILRLEEHEHDRAYDPVTAVQLCFFDGTSPDAQLRGFNLPSFGGADGILPARYRDSVQNRVDEILLWEQEDGSIDIGKLRSTYSWPRYVLGTVNWIRKRTDEIAKDLKKSVSAQNVHDRFFNASAFGLDGARDTPEATPSGALDNEGELAEKEVREPEVTAPPVPQPPPESVQGDRERTAPPVLQPAPESVQGDRERTAPPVPQPPPASVQGDRERTAPPVPQPPPASVQGDRERRRSSKPSYLDSSSILRIAQRQERLRSETANPETRRHSDIVRPTSEIVIASEQSATDRRQTLQPLPSRSIQEKEREIPASPEASLTLLPEESNITLGDDLDVLFGNDATMVERSHSPPVNRIAPPPHREASPAESGNATARIMRELKAKKTSAGPSRITRPAFIDRQHNAERVSPISQATDSQNAVSRVEARVSRKRARQASEESDEENDFSRETLFDYDRVERTRAEKPQPRNKRPRLNGEGERGETATVPVNDSEDEDEPAPSTQTRTRTAPWVGPQPAVQSATIQSAAIQKDSLIAKRAYWIPEEDARFIRLIGECGPRWAQIQRQNEAQPVRPGEVRIEGRNQVQLKDRARNLKIKCIREGRELPKNFHLVTMGEKDFQMLERRGINVDRYR